MHIQSCEHPIKIFNPYSKELMYVRCGKCDMCRNNHAKRWVDRLEQERACHPFTFFVYLDYDDEHLPHFVACYDAVKKERYLVDSTLVDDYENFNADVYEENCIPYSELKFEDKFDAEYFDARIAHPLGIPHGSVRDLQLFFKRLNKQFHDKVTQTYNNFRYFIVVEFGPTSHRPHMHGLVFVDSQEVADRFGEIFCKCWHDKQNRPLGHADYDYVESTASSYVAQYLNCDTHLPSFYAHPKIRPFFLCSRQPPIGSLLQSETEVLEIFHSGSPERVLQTSTASTSVSLVPLLPSFKDKLFPKCPRFDSLSHSFRVTLYGLADVEEGRYFNDFERFKEYFLDKCFPFFYKGDYMCRSLDYYNDTNLNRYLCVITDNFDNDRPLREIFRISKRVLYQAVIFGVTLDYYVSRIELFYQNLKLYHLKDFYESQQNLLSDGETCIDDLVHMYPLNRDMWRDSLSLDLNICDVPDFKNQVLLHKEISKNNTKVSKKNAYFEGRLKYRDPLLYNLIKKFYYGKKRYEDAETLA